MMDTIEHYLGKKKIKKISLLTEMNLTNILNYKEAFEEKIDAVFDALDSLYDKAGNVFVGEVPEEDGSDSGIFEPFPEGAEKLWKEMKADLATMTSQSGPEDLKKLGWAAGKGNLENGFPKDGKIKALTGLALSKWDKGSTVMGKDGRGGGQGIKGQRGSGGAPSGAEWEHIITDQYNILMGKPGAHKDATDTAIMFYGDPEEGSELSLIEMCGRGIAEDIAKEITGGSMMKQFGGGKKASNLSTFWKKHGATDGTPKTDMHTDNYSISLKKAGGSQLASGGEKETLATFYAALEYMGVSRESQPNIDRIMTEIETKYGKVATHLSKAALNKLAALPQGKVHPKNQAAVAQYIEIEKFHKMFNAEIIKDKLLDPVKDATFREFLCYEAASGQMKFGKALPVARASVCCKFKVSTSGKGEVTDWLDVTAGGLKSGFGKKPKISPELKKLSAAANCYTAWKSSSGNPYSVLRIGMKENKELNNIPTAKNILREVILNDKLVRAVNKDAIAEGEQLNEFEFFYKAMNAIVSGTKKVAKSVGQWLVGIWKEFFKKIKVMLAKIRKMGKDIFPALYEFLGIEPTKVKIKYPSKLKTFLK